MNLFYLTPLQRGIFLRILIAYLVLTGLTAFVFFISQSPRIIRTISELGLPFSSFFHYSFTFLIPSTMVAIPAILLISICYVYRNLDQESQIIGMKSIGMRAFEVIKPALMFSGIVCVLVILGNGFILPLAQKTIKTMPTTISSEGISNFLKPDLFNSLRGKVMIYVSEKISGGILGGILIQDESNPGKIRTYMAEKGYMRIDKNTKWLSIVMEKGTLQEVDLENKSHQSISFSEYRFLIKPGFFGKANLTLQDNNIFELGSVISSGSSDASYEAFWEIERRLAEALSLLVAAVSVTLIVVGNSRHIPTFRFLAGSAIGFLYTSGIYFFGSAVNRSGVFSSGALINQHLILMVGLGICLIALFRMRNKGLL